METNVLNENEMNFLKKIQNLKRTNQLEMVLPFGSFNLIDIYYNELNQIVFYTIAEGCNYEFDFDEDDNYYLAYLNDSIFNSTLYYNIIGKLTDKFEELIRKHVRETFGVRIMGSYKVDYYKELSFDLKEANEILAMKLKLKSKINLSEDRTN